ncbi:MAG: hypothetical protein AAF226_03995 [Verrucomicrobiota bacterium]
MKRVVLTAIFSLFTIGISSAQEEIDFTLSPAWDSRYIQQGHDTIPGEGLTSMTAEAAYGDWAASLWYAWGFGADYEEYQASIARSFEIEGWEFTGNYTYLDFVSAGGDDHELGLFIASPDFGPGLVASAYWYYSFTAEGTFLDLFLERPTEITDRLSITPGVFFGSNFGYYADGHRGANHVEFNLGADYAVCENFVLSAYVRQSLAIDSDAATYGDDAALGDIFYGGVSATISF